MTEYPNIIKLNVRGTQFQTRKATLTRIPNWFKTIIDKRQPLEKDDSGAYFIDRSAKHFEKVLNFMADGTVTLPNSKEEISEIALEADAYQLKGLGELCVKKLLISESIVRFNVRGTHFESRRSTLCKYPNWFKERIDNNVFVERDDTGAIFIDRDPKHFHLILNFMKDGYAEAPDNHKEIREILLEALLYQLDSLVRWCEMKLQIRYIDKLVKLNISGTHFQTSRSTLMKYDGFFKTLLETDRPIPLDDTGAIFIDRPATHFNLILTYMRDGDVVVPENHLELLIEAHHYGLEGLINRCVFRLPPNLCQKLKFIRTDIEFDKILKDSKEHVRPIVVISFNPSAWAEVFQNTAPERFVEKNKDKFDTYFKSDFNFNQEETNWRYEILFKRKRSGLKSADSPGFLRAIEKDIDQLHSRPFSALKYYC